MKLTIRDIRSVVSNYTGISDITVKDRSKDLAYARHLYCYFCRKQTKATWKKIASFCGGRDHKTAFSSVKRLQDLYDTEAAVRKDVENIKSLISQPDN